MHTPTTFWKVPMEDEEGPFDYPTHRQPYDGEELPACDYEGVDNSPCRGKWEIVTFPGEAQLVLCAAHQNPAATRITEGEYQDLVVILGL